MTWLLPVGLALLTFAARSVSSVRLSSHFTLAELTRTSTGLDNTPPSSARNNLVHLLAELAEPLRAAVGPLKVTSGYRSFAVNDAVGGANGSRHMTGEAVDVAPLRVSSPEAMKVLFELVGLGEAVVDQAILYHPARGGHLHLGWRATAPRGQFLYAPQTGGYETWKP